MLKEVKKLGQNYTGLTFYDVSGDTWNFSLRG